MTRKMSEILLPTRRDTILCAPQTLRTWYASNHFLFIHSTLFNARKWKTYLYLLSSQDQLSIILNNILQTNLQNIDAYVWRIFLKSKQKQKCLYEYFSHNLTMGTNIQIRHKTCIEKSIFSILGVLTNLLKAIVLHEG